MLSSECDTCLAIAMNGKKGGVVYTCLVDGASQLGSDGKSECLKKEGVDVGYDVSFNNPNGEGGGLNVVVSARLEHNGRSGFVGLRGCLMKEGVDGVLSVAVRRVRVDEAVFDLMVILLYVESTRQCVCWCFGHGWEGKG